MRQGKDGCATADSLNQDSVAPKTTREKCLQDLANTLCQMFCGWRLTESKPILVELGSGAVEIDALTGECTFRNMPMPQLPIAKDLVALVENKLAFRRISSADVTRARLVANLSLTRVPWNLRITMMFPVVDEAESSKRSHQCSVDCESQVVIDGIVYRSRLKEVQEWFLVSEGSDEDDPPRRGAGVRTHREL